MDHLPTFSTLRAADDIPVAETTADVDEEALDYWRDHAGIVVLGLRNEAGGVLLMDSTHGWRLPYVPVGDDGWLPTARDAARALVGVAVDVVGVDRVERVDHRGPAGDRTVTHDVVVRSARLPGTPVADDPRLPA